MVQNNEATPPPISSEIHVDSENYRLRGNIPRVFNLHVTTLALAGHARRLARLLSAAQLQVGVYFQLLFVAFVFVLLSPDRRLHRLWPWCETERGKSLIVAMFICRNVRRNLVRTLQIRGI